jgi:hypothetical protein
MFSFSMGQIVANPHKPASPGNAQIRYVVPPIAARMGQLGTTISESIAMTQKRVGGTSWSFATTAQAIQRRCETARLLANDASGQKRRDPPWQGQRDPPNPRFPQRASLRTRRIDMGTALGRLSEPPILPVVSGNMLTTRVRCRICVGLCSLRRRVHSGVVRVPCAHRKS